MDVSCAVKGRVDRLHPYHGLQEAKPVLMHQQGIIGAERLGNDSPNRDHLCYCSKTLISKCMPNQCVVSMDTLVTHR